MGERKSFAAFGTETAQKERRTMDLLDLLAQKLGYKDGILLGQVNELLDLAIRTVSDRDAIVKDLEEIAQAGENATPFGMIQTIREKLGHGETYRTRLFEINRELAEITGMKHIGATISDQIAAINRAFASIAPPALPLGSSYAAVVLRSEGAELGDESLVESADRRPPIPSRPVSDLAGINVIANDCAPERTLICSRDLYDAIKKAAKP